jgi:DNA-binding CsgD family transcriptional regulator
MRYVSKPSGDQKKLSFREQQVLDLLAKGLIYNEICRELNIGAETVRTYVKQICKKLNVRNRIEAIAKYWQGTHIEVRPSGRPMDGQGVAMDAAVGDGNKFHGEGWLNEASFYVVTKSTAFHSPGPNDCEIFTDEHPSSIDDRIL